MGFADTPSDASGGGYRWAVADSQQDVRERVRSVLVEATLAPGPGHVFGGGSEAEVARAYAAGARTDKIYVHATVIAKLDSGRSVARERPDMGCSVQRVFGAAGGDIPVTRGREEIELHVRTMLGLGEHRPPHLGWDRLIASLARNGIAVSEDALMALPIAIELSQALHHELAGVRD